MSAVLLLLGGLFVGLLVLYGLFRRKLAQGAAAWKQVGERLALGFTPLGSQIGRLEGKVQGFDVHVEVVNTESGPEEGFATYTWIRVEGVEVGCSTAAELDGATHGFVGRLGEGTVEWIRGGIVFDPRTLEKGIRDAIAAAQASSDADFGAVE